MTSSFSRQKNPNMEKPLEDENEHDVICRNTNLGEDMIQGHPTRI